MSNPEGHEDGEKKELSAEEYDKLVLEKLREKLPVTINGVEINLDGGYIVFPQADQNNKNVKKFMSRTGRPFVNAIYIEKTPRTEKEAKIGSGSSYRNLLNFFSMAVSIARRESDPYEVAVRIKKMLQNSSSREGAIIMEAHIGSQRELESKVEEHVRMILEGK